jgi:hypothetical protein
MAVMIPAVIHSDVSSSAEKRIFRLLRDAPNTEDWVVLHSLGLAKHQTKRRGEIDFLVICSRGIFVLEVKGGRVARNNGVWITRDRYGNNNKLNESPFEQAASAMFSLEKYIKNNHELGEKLGKLIFGYGVVLPNSPSFDVEPDGDAQITYFLEDTRQSIARYIGRIALFSEEQTLGKRKRPTHKDIDELVSYLRGDFDVVLPLWEKIRETDDELLQLTKEQYQILSVLDIKPRVIVRGAAGTGKTLIANKEATTAASRRTNKVLFVCYNRFLASKLNQNLVKEQFYKNITVCSLYQLMDELIRDSAYGEEFAQKKQLSDNDEIYSVLYPEYASLAVMDNDAISWDILIVDEGQDFISEPVLDFFDLCLVGGLESGNWRWFMDDNNQAAVFGRNEPASIERLESFGVSHMLTINCRNTVQIQEETQMLSTPRARAIARVEGLPVRYVWFGSNQISALMRQIDRINKEGVSKSDVVILSARSISESAAAKITSDNVLPFEQISLTNNKNINHIPYTTISTFKGLEADIVILTDIEKLDGDWWRAVLYVGMTRTRVELVVLLPEKLRNIYNAKVNNALALLDDEE